jgi:YD repeat-containing protein
MRPLLPYVTLVFMVLASSNLYAQYPAAANEELRKNKIKKVWIQDFSCHPDPKDPRRFKASTTYAMEYDTRGNLIYDSTQSKWAEYPRVTAYKYDDKNNPIEETHDGRVWATSEYTFDSKGLIAKRTIWNGDHMVSDKQEFTRNDKGNVLERTSFLGNSGYKYDAAGNLVESTQFHLDGSPYVKETYDDKGRMTERLLYGADSGGYLSERTVYTYGAAGVKASEEKYDSGGHLSSSSVNTTVSTYDDAGHKTKEEKYGPDGKTQGWSTFKLDAKGFVVERDEFDSKGACSSISKTYYEFYP